MRDRLIALHFISLILLVGIGLDFCRYGLFGKSTLGSVQGLGLLGASLFTLFATNRKIPSLFDISDYTIEPTELSETMGELARLRQRKTL